MHHRAPPSVLWPLASALLLAMTLRAQSIVTFPEGHAVTDGSTISFGTYSTSPTDTVNLTGSTSHTVTVGAGASPANLFVSGSGSYNFAGTRVTTTGKLILGALATGPTTIPYTTFTGTLDFTQITGTNNFASGIDINTGALRVGSKAQLGLTTLNLTFTGSGGALLIADNANMTYDDNYGGMNRIIVGPNATSTIAVDANSCFAINRSTDLTAGSIGGGAIFIGANSTLTLTGTNGGGFLFDANTTATGRGGAINVNSANAVAIIDSATFTNNSNGTGQTNGGAIAIGANTARLVMRDSVFKNNKTSPAITNGAGGAIANQGGTVMLTNVLFDSNTANQAGAFMNAGPSVTINSSTFVNNIATTNANGGGALFNNNGNSTINLLNVLFLSNTAAAGGGGAYTAVSGAGGSTINLSNVSFLDNYAATVGGAIYINGANGASTNLTVTSGTSRFAGNTAGGTANSIYYINNNGGNTGSILVNTAVSGATLDMLDPFTVVLGHINAGINITKSGAGTWKLSGTNVIQKGGSGASGTAAFNINAGTLHLYRAGEQVTDDITGKTYTSTAGAIILHNTTANTNMAAYFRLAAGANLSVGGGNTIAMTSVPVTTENNYPNARIIFDPGSIITFDLDHATAAAAGASAPLLTISVADSLPAANLRLVTSGTFNSILSLNYSAQLPDMLGNTYNLLTVVSGSSGEGRLGNLTNFAALVQNGIYDGLTYAELNELGYRATAGITNDILWIKFLEALSGNSVLTWAGTSDSAWSGGNWVSSGTELPFTQADIINLAGTPGITTINADTDTLIGGMYVSGNANYTITGTSITAAATVENSTISGKAAATNQLVLGAKATDDASIVTPLAFTGTLTLANDSNDFTGGININTGALVGNNLTLGSGAVGITNNGTLIFDQTATGTYAAPISGTGVLIKASSGALTLAANSSAFTGATKIDAGSLILGGSAVLGSPVITVNSTGVFGGSGTAAGAVTINTGGALMAGMAHADPTSSATETLSIAGALTLNTGATLQYDLRSSGLGDHITVGSLNVTGGAASVTVELNAAFSGTYALLNSIGASNANIGNFMATLASGGGITGRTTAGFDIVGNSLLLKILTSNTTLSWNGMTGSVWDNNQGAVWTGGDTHFIAGDSVTFDDSYTGTNHIVTIGENIIASGITIDTAATYAFTGTGSLTTSTAGTDLAGATGKLTKKGAGTLEFTNDAANNFTGGISISGGTLGFANGTQLGDGGNGIRFTDDAALRANATTSLGNNITIDAGKTATIDTGTNALAYGGLLNSTGTLAKIGAGVMTFTADNSGNTGIVQIDQGILGIDTADKLGGTINIADGATLAGGGGATGTVNAGTNARIAPGALSSSTPVTLTIANLNLDSAILNFNIFKDGTNDRIDVTGASNFTGANKIDISIFQTGTFNLGTNLAALYDAGTQVTIGGATQIVDARQHATLSKSGNDLLLIGVADISRILYWTGSAGDTWNVADRNWTDNETIPTTLYAGGDKVIFDDGATPSMTNISIASTGVMVSDIIVTGTSSYTFDGGGITANPASVISGSVIATGTGKLIKAGTGTLALSNTAANNFLGGIDIAEGAITFTKGNQLGDGGSGAGILFSGDAALATNVTGQTIASNITVAAGVTGTLDAGANTLTLSGALTVAGGSGTLAKTGTGRLNITGISTGADAANLVLGIAAGSANLNNAIFGGTIDLASDTLLIGTGTSYAGAVHSTEITTLQLNNDALFAIDDLRLADSSTLTGSGAIIGGATLSGTLIANIAAGNALVLGGTVAGAGGILKNGTGTLQYVGASSLLFTGTTQINQGAVSITGISTGDLIPPSAVSTNIMLNGGTLAFGSGTTAAVIDFARDWRDINLIHGDNAAASTVVGDNDIIHVGSGAIDYALRSALHIAVDAGDGVTVFSNTTNNYTGLVRVNSGTFQVSGNHQLGTVASNVSKISLNGGVLEITGSLTTVAALDLHADGAVITADGVATQWGGINVSGTGQYTFTKLGSGTLTIANVSHAAALNVAEGHYATTRGQGLGNGLVTVAAGATVELRPTGVTPIPNNFTGSGTLLITSGSNTYTGTSIAIDNIVVQGATTNITSVNDQTPVGFGTPGGKIRIDTARLNLGAPSTTLGNVILANNARLGFVADASGKTFKTASLASLAGSGTLALNTNLDKGLADRIDILDSLDGNYTLRLANAGDIPGDYVPAVTLITAPLDSTGTFALPGDKFDVSLFTYGLTTSTTNGAFEVSLTRLGSLSNSAAFITSMAAALPLSWFSELTSVSQRMGELRFEKRPGAGGAGWVRGYGEKINYNDKITGTPFGERHLTAEAGFDYKVGGTKNNVYVGGFAGYGQSQRDYSAAGEGLNESVFVGLYQVMAFKSGWYFDTIFKADVFKNRFTAIAAEDDTVTASYRSWAAGISLEVGKFYDIGRGWFVEPQIQGAFAILKDQTYTTSNDMIVDMSFCTVVRGRVGLRIGRTFTTAKGNNVSAYLKFYGAGQSTSGGELDVTLSNGRTVRFDSTIKGFGFEGGAGIAWQFAKATHVFFDYDATNAEYYTKPWGVNLGVRYGW